MLSILGLLEPPSSGDVLVDQTSVTQLSRRQLARLRGRKLGYVFQSFNLLAGLTVAENVMLSGLLAGESGRAQYDRAIELLDEFGMAEKAKRVNRIPMGRFVEVEEIAAHICWLASEDCSFSTGAVFDISGGRATY